jgi:hypothetical protein
MGLEQDRSLQEVQYYQASPLFSEVGLLGLFRNYEVVVSKRLGIDTN